MSGRLIGYPTGWTLAVFDGADAAETAMAELTSSGIGTDDLILLAGRGRHRADEPARCLVGARRPDATRDAVHDDGPAARPARLRAGAGGRPTRPWPANRRLRAPARRHRRHSPRRRALHQPIRRVGDRGDRPVARRDAEAAASTCSADRPVSSPSHDTQAHAGQRGRLPRRAGRRARATTRATRSARRPRSSTSRRARPRSTPSSASFRPRTRSRRPTPSSAPRWRARRPSPPPAARASA